MTYGEFKDSVLYELDKAEKELLNEQSILDLRVFRHPYKTNVDNAIFCVNDIHDAWEFVKNAREWAVDVFENIYKEGETPYAEYTGCSVVDVGETLLERIDAGTIYTLRWIGGVQYIHILGYFYDAGTDGEENETWRNVEFCGLELPLAEYNAMTAEERSALESESKQWVEVLTKEEVLDFFDEHAPVFLHHEDVNENTHDNLTYIAIR